MVVTGTSRAVSASRAASTRTAEAEVLRLIEDLSPGERRTFSYRRALQHLVQVQERSIEPASYTCLEAELSKAMAKCLKRTTGGMFLPTSLRTQSERMELAHKTRAGLDTKTGAAGGYLVESAVSADVIELLRAQLVLARMGARVMNGLTDVLAFAAQRSGTTAVWEVENPASDVDLTASTYGQRVLIPRSLTATTAFTRKLLAQSAITPDIEVEVRRDLAAAHAVEIDKAGITGSGTANEPVGMLNVSGIGSVACGSDGAIPTFGNIVDLETAVAKANFDTSNGAYLSTPGMRGKLKQVAEASGSSNMIWRDNDQVNGRAAFVSTNVPSTLVKNNSGAVCHAILFADWSQLIVGEWGVMEVLVDPMTFKRQGLVEVTSYQLVDLLLKTPAALAAILDGKIS